jgi:hypothetical protein
VRRSNHGEKILMWLWGLTHLQQQQQIRRRWLCFATKTLRPTEVLLLLLLQLLLHQMAALAHVSEER